jgi:hypothetical protein
VPTGLRAHPLRDRRAPKTMLYLSRHSYIQHINEHVVYVLMRLSVFVKRDTPDIPRDTLKSFRVKVVQSSFFHATQFPPMLTCKTIFLFCSSCSRRLPTHRMKSVNIQCVPLKGGGEDVWPFRVCPTLTQCHPTTTQVNSVIAQFHYCQDRM